MSEREDIQQVDGAPSIPSASFMLAMRRLDLDQETSGIDPTSRDATGSRATEKSSCHFLYTGV